MLIYLPTPRDGICGPCGDDPCGGADPYSICGVDVSARGNDEGYSQAFTVPARYLEDGLDLLVRLEAWDVPDRLRLIAGDGAVLYDSGYVGTLVGTQWFVEAPVAVPAGTTTITAEVNVHPDFRGTRWVLRITCLPTAP